MRELSYDNVVLIGDALHTAIILSDRVLNSPWKTPLRFIRRVRPRRCSERPCGIESARRTEVEITQHAAEVSVVWTENVKRYREMEAIQAAYSMLTRSKQITHENLRLRRGFISDMEAWFSGKFGRSKSLPPMFLPLRWET